MQYNRPIDEWTSDRKLKHWIHGIATMCEPDSVWLCDGSEEEYAALAAKLVESGTFIPLNPKKRPNSFLARSTPEDVARVEEATFICSKKKKMPAQQIIGKTLRS